MKIRTNHHWRQFTYAWDVPAAVLADQFDYQDREVVLDGFFCYRGIWYHLDQFMRWTCPQDYSPENYWTGYASESFFSGVLVKLSDGGEEYQVATYTS